MVRPASIGEILYRPALEALVDPKPLAPLVGSSCLCFALFRVDVLVVAEGTDLGGADHAHTSDDDGCFGTAHLVVGTLGVSFAPG